MPQGRPRSFTCGYRQPSKSAPPEKDPKSPREGRYRVPRIVVDLVSARPIDLAIVEGVNTMTGGEGPWIAEAVTVVSPGVIVAGTNPVTTDAVCMAVMGFDPMADRGTPPFETCDSTLQLAEEVGIGHARSEAHRGGGQPGRTGALRLRRDPKTAANGEEVEEAVLRPVRRAPR